MRQLRDQSEPDHGDAFTEQVMTRMDAGIVDELSDAQRLALRKAISASAPMKRHPVDVRGIIPLFFTRWYFLFLMGPDRRSAGRGKESKRREAATIAGFGVGLYLLL